MAEPARVPVGLFFLFADLAVEDFLRPLLALRRKRESTGLSRVLDRFDRTDEERGAGRLDVARRDRIGIFGQIDHEAALREEDLLVREVQDPIAARTAREVSEQLAARAERLRGECVLVVAGSPGPAATPARAWPDALRALRGESVAADLSPRVLVDLLACVYPGQRNAIYRAVHAEGEEPT